MALAVSALMLTAIVTLTSRSVTTSANSKNKTQANRYVDEAMEFIRREEINEGYTDFKNNILTNGGWWCLITLDLTTNEACDPDDAGHNISGTIFQRTLSASGSDTTKSIDIKIWVKWTDESGAHETYSISSIGNW